MVDNNWLNEDDYSSTDCSSDEWSDDEDDCLYSKFSVITSGLSARVGINAVQPSNVTAIQSNEKDLMKKIQHSNILRNTSFPSRSQSMMSLSAVRNLRKLSVVQPGLISQNLMKSTSTPSVLTSTIDIEQGTSAQNDIKHVSQQERDQLPAKKPDDHMKNLLLLQGIDAKPCPSLSLEGFFMEMTEKNIAAYETDVVNAFRQADLEAVKGHHEKGKLLQCCNKFGESVVHLTCRRGSHKILKFLLEEADVSVRVRDDSGRTPLHDACWTNSPNYDLITLLLEHCPDLLLISDSRGFTPLNYVPKNLWGDWCKFLEDSKDLLKPKFIPGGTLLSSESCQLNKRKRA